VDGYGEICFYSGKLHAKSTLIDDQLLIIGWQNMCYSALGKGALKKHSLTTNNPAAINEFKALFETKWKEAVPFENTQFSTSP
jgi:hypothetical protein